MPSDKPSVPPEGATMQLDALVDDLEEVDAPDLGHMMSAPPPLPPKKAGKAVWILGGLVVVLATGLGLGVGLFFLSQQSSAAVEAPAASAPATAPEASEAVAPAEESEPENVVNLEDFVFEDTTELAEPSEEEEELPAE